MTTEWSSNVVSTVNTAEFGDMSCSLVDYSDISYDQKNIAFDWYFPAIDLYEDRQWLLFEDKLELNDSSISEICDIFKKKLICEFQTEIFLQHPLIIQKLIKWLNENKEIELILECLNYFVEKLIKRHFECTSGLCENFESFDTNYGSNSQITTETNYETTNSDEISRWGIAKLCVSLVPTILKHIAFNYGEAFSLFMSSLHLLSSIADSCNIKFNLELIFSNCTIKHILLNEPLSSLKFLIIAKELLPYYLPNEQFKEVILNILKQPYWIHLYPDLYNQLYIKIVNEELLELKIIKMVKNAFTLSFSSNLDIKHYGQLLSTSLPIIWFHQKFNIIDKFIGDICKYANLTTDTNGNEYSNILLDLLSYKSSDVVIHTYSVLNKTVKSILNNFNSQSKKFNRLLEHLLCTKVLNEIVCFGCASADEQICQLASEIMELLLKCKNSVKIDQWKIFFCNLVPILPVLYCYATQSSNFGQIIFNFFHPDQAEKYNISNLMLLHSIIIMLVSKEKKCRVEANNRITWFLQTTLNKTIDLPNDIFVIEFNDLNEKVEEPIGEYSTNDLDDMIDLIENKSSHQTVKCALYKISVMLEYSHLQQHFIHSGGMNIILNLLKSSKLFVNERGLLIALLKLILCFTKKKKLIIDENNLMEKNFDIQLILISVLSDFYEIPLVKQYILQIFFFCIFNQYLTKFNEMPTIVVGKIYIPIQINKYWTSNNNYNDISLITKIKETKSCMDVLMLTWNLKHFDNTDLFLENGLATNTQGSLFHVIFYNFRKANIKWSVKKNLIDLIAAKSHTVALSILGDLKRYLELSVHIEQFEVDEELLENALRKFLILPPILLSDLQTLIVVMKLLNFLLQRRILISKFHWVPIILLKSKCMHHNMADDFKNDDISNQLCNKFFVELYEVYWLCLKNYSSFSTLDLTKLLFHQLPSMKNELVLLQVNMRCLTLLTENPKNIDKDLVKLFLSQLIPLKTILMNRCNEKSLIRSYLTILNHILHHTILVPNICEVWCIYDWETWTWSMIHSTDPIVRALIFQFSAGLAVIDIPVSHSLINLALNYICETHCLENCIVAEQATIFCSNVFCHFKFKNLCHQCFIRLDFNIFIKYIDMCSHDDVTKYEKKNFSTSPKLVANICCMLFNMITLTEIDLQKFDQNNKFLHSLIICLKKNLSPVCIEEHNIMEMCGRICSILTLFIPVSNYSFENVLTSLNIIYERIDVKLDHCTTMVWRSLFKLTTKIILYTNYNTFIITNNLISALLKSITSKNNDLSIDALNVVAALCSLLSKQFANRVCKVLIETLILDWSLKQKRTMLLIALSNMFLEHPFTYETAKEEHLLYFVTSKLKMMLLQITKQSSQKSKTLQNNYLEIVGFFCNIFHGCVQAREDASTELPDVIHKLWPMIVSNPKSDILIGTIKMLVSLTSTCPSACSAMTMTSSTLGVDPKTKITSYSLFHEIISLSNDFNLHGDIFSIVLLIISNCCQALECRTIITKSKLLCNIISALNLKDKKRYIKIEQECLHFLLIFTSYNEGQIYLLKVDYALDILVDLLKSNYKNDSLAILRNLCFNVQNRVAFLSSDVFLNGIKSMLEEGNLTNQHYKDISLSIWSIACNNQKARLELRHWGIDKYFEKCDLSLCNDETRSIMNCTYNILKSK